MNKYTTYCTEEQTKKAFELGANLEIIDCDVWVEYNSSIGTSGIPRDSTKMTDYLYYDGECDDENMRRNDVLLIKDTEDYGDMVVYLPTAEEMIGWLEDCYNDIDITIERYSNGRWVYFIKWQSSGYFSSGYYNSRKEATLAAIDAALEYLEKKRNFNH